MLIAHAMGCSIMEKMVLLFETDLLKLQDDVQDVNKLRRLLDNFMNVAHYHNITYEAVTQFTSITASTLNRFINRKTTPYDGTLDQFRQLVLDLKQTSLQLDSKDIVRVLNTFKSTMTVSGMQILSQLHHDCLLFAVDVHMNILMLEGGKAKAFESLLKEQRQTIDSIGINKESVFYHAIEKAIQGKDSVVNGTFLNQSYVSGINPMRNPETREITGCIGVMIPQPGRLN